MGQIHDKMVEAERREGGSRSPISTFRAIIHLRSHTFTIRLYARATTQGAKKSLRRRKDSARRSDKNLPQRQTNLLLATDETGRKKNHARTHTHLEQYGQKIARAPAATRNSTRDQAAILVTASLPNNIFRSCRRPANHGRRAKTGGQDVVGPCLSRQQQHIQHT